jgi:urocanate hydratase
MSGETPDPRRRERKSTPNETMVLVGFWDDFRRPLFDVGGGPFFYEVLAEE